MTELADLLKEMFAQMTLEQRRLLKDNRQCFTHDDWATLVQDAAYLSVMLAIARLNEHY